MGRVSERYFAGALIPFSQLRRWVRRASPNTIRLCRTWSGEGHALSQDQVESLEFRVAVSGTGDHEGEIRFEGKPSLPTSSAPIFGGEADRYSPQDLFVSAVAACFLTTFVTFAKRAKVAVKAVDIEGRGVVQRDAASGWRFTDVYVTMRIGVPDTVSKSAVQRVAELTEKFCMISRSVKCQVHLDARVATVP